MQRDGTYRSNLLGLSCGLGNAEFWDRHSSILQQRHGHTLVHRQVPQGHLDIYIIKGKYTMVYYSRVIHGHTLMHRQVPQGHLDIYNIGGKYTMVYYSRVMDMY